MSTDKANFLQLEDEVIPPEILDLVKFLAKYVMDLHELQLEVYKTNNIDLLINKFPILQGTNNQIKMKNIGKQKYNPDKLRDGFNTLPDGEEIFFISNPGLGLWANKEKFNKSPF